MKTLAILITAMVLILQPVTATALDTGYTSVAAGSGTAYALRDDGSIAVWGSDNHGQHGVPLPNSGYVAMRKVSLVK